MKSKLILCAALACVSSPVFAHVIANPNEGEAGKYFQTSFRISHGCDGSPTKRIKIEIPPGFVTLKPQAKPGWQIKVEKRKLEKPVPAAHGKMATEEFASVTWEGELADDQYDEFGILVKLPDNPGTLWFPVTQTCAKGEMKWSEVPQDMSKWHELKSPAPFVKLTGKEPEAHDHSHMSH